MLNQEKTGKYIAEKRRQAGMTQKEFARLLGRTDKAVSKWETGKSIPDPSVMEDLCRILNISMNEFLSGEDIKNEIYSSRAEENMKVLLREQSKLKKRSGIILLCITIGLVFVLTGLYAFSLNIGEMHEISSFIDLPSFLFLPGIVLVMLVLSSALFDFFRIFPLCFKKRKPEAAQVCKSVRALKLVLVLNILSPLFILAGHMVLLPVAEYENLAQVLSVYFVPVWYGVFWDMILFPFLFRLYNCREDVT